MIFFEYNKRLNLCIRFVNLEMLFVFKLVLNVGFNKLSCTQNILYITQTQPFGMFLRFIDKIAWKV